MCCVVLACFGMAWSAITGLERKRGMEWKSGGEERKEEGEEEGEVQKDDVDCCLSLTDLPGLHVAA